MNRYQQLRDKLKNCELVVMGNILLLQNPIFLSAFQNADCVLLDKEHGVFGTEELIPLTLQCRALKLPSIVRVEDPVYHLIAKTIEMGADGIMLPRTETVEQVKIAVEAMHFAPIGRTGFGGWGLFQDENETIESFQRSRILLVQIESPKGLAEMENMLKSYGEYIDGFIIGPNDYSIMMGVPRDHINPVMIKEYEKFYSICKKYHKSCGIFDPDYEHAARDKAMGANIFWISDDFNYLKSGFETFMNMVRAL